MARQKTSLGVWKWQILRANELQVPGQSRDGRATHNPRLRREKGGTLMRAIQAGTSGQIHLKRHNTLIITALQRTNTAEN